MTRSGQWPGTESFRGLPKASRRHFLRTVSVLGAGALLARTRGVHAAQTAPAGRPPDPSRPLLLSGGVVLSMDPAVGDFAAGDVLIEDGRVTAVAASLEAGDARVLDAQGMIIMPGFVDTHRHMWQGQIRNLMPDGTLEDYLQRVLFGLRSHYRPADAYIGDLVSALSALDAGVTTVLDWSHIGNTPAHTDAAIMGLADAGVRAVYAYGAGVAGPENRFPGDIQRLRREFFDREDRLLTLAMAAGTDPADWAVARDAGAPITSHVNASGTLPPLAGDMGPDNTYIHCNRLMPEEFDLIARTGGGVSISGPIEMAMGHGEPPYQQVIDRDIPWALSNDVETQVPGEFFTQMRQAYSLQRMKIFSRRRGGEADTPPLMTAGDVLRVATLGGARVNHLADRVGTLTPGKDADVLMLDMNRINVLPVNNADAAVVLGMDTSNVRHVLVRGRPRKWNGSLTGVDLEEVSDRAHRSRDALLRRAGLTEDVV